MDNNSISEELVLNESARDHLNIVRKWVFAISIVGLSVVLFLFSISVHDYISLSKWDDIPSGGGVGFILMGIWTLFIFFISVISFVPFYYLYRFSYYLKMALDVDDSELLETSFRYLKLHYKSIGILTIVFVVIYLLLFNSVLKYFF